MPGAVYNETLDHLNLRKKNVDQFYPFNDEDEVTKSIKEN